MLFPDTNAFAFFYQKKQHTITHKERTKQHELYS